MEDPGATGAGPFRFLSLPLEIQCLIVRSAGSMAKKTLFVSCHATRRLVLSAVDHASINLEPGAGTDLPMAALLLQLPASSSLAQLRIGRRPGGTPSCLPILQDALLACRTRALHLWVS